MHPLLSHAPAPQIVPPIARPQSTAPPPQCTPASPVCCPCATCRTPLLRTQAPPSPGAFQRGASPEVPRSARLPSPALQTPGVRGPRRRLLARSQNKQPKATSSPGGQLSQRQPTPVTAGSGFRSQHNPTSLTGPRRAGLRNPDGAAPASAVATGGERAWVGGPVHPGRRNHLQLAVKASPTSRPTYSSKQAPKAR